MYDALSENLSSKKDLNLENALSKMFVSSTS